MCSIPRHTGLFKIIREKYDKITVGTVRHYIKTAEMIASSRQHLTFNIRAKRYGLIPRSLRVHPLVHSQEGRQIAMKTSRNFLLARIGENVKKIRQRENDLFFQCRQLEFHLHQADMTALEEVRQKAQDKMTAKCKKRQKKKFDTMLTRREHGHRNTNDCGNNTERWINNYSSKELTPNEKSVLAKGLNFAPSPRNIPIPAIIASVEDGLRKVRSGNNQAARIDIIDALKKAKIPASNITPSESKAIKDLQRDDSIIILPADKGRSTVLLNKLDYEKKIESMLSDGDTYKRLSRDPAPALERRVNSFLLTLKKIRSAS